MTIVRLDSLDPTFRLAARQSFSSPVGIVAASWLAFGRWQEPLDAVVAALGVFCLVYATPQGVIRLVELEQSGRLDQLRLTGQRPERLLAALLLGSALPWASVGLVLLGLSATAAPLALESAAFAGAVIGASVVISLFAIARPSPRAGLDARIVSVGLACAALVAAIMSVETEARQAAIAVLVSQKLTAALGISSNTTLLILIGCEAAMAAALAKRVIKAVARPALPRLHSGRIEEWLRANPRLPPAIRRGWVLSVVPALALAILMGAAVASVRLFAPDDPFVFAWLFALFPLPIGAVVISSICRGDSDSGRSDIIRVADTTPWRSAVLTVTGLWLPFILASVALVAILSVTGIGDEIRRPGLVLLALLMTAPTAMLEGWNRAALMSYSYPAAVAALLMGLNQLQLFGFAVTPTLAVVWIPWALVASALRSGVDIPLRPGLSRWAVVTISFATFQPYVFDGFSSRLGAQSLQTAAVLLLVGSWFARCRLDMPLLVAMAFTGTRLAGGYRFEFVEALLAGVPPAVAFWIGQRIHGILGTKAVVSLAVRVLLAGGLLLWGLEGWTLVFRLMVNARANADALRAVTLTTLGTNLAIVLLVAVVVEYAARWASSRVTLRP